jgi:putative transcriptional regulator
MYHYTESGLPDVWLKGGYVTRQTPYGKGIAIRDVAGLQKAICNAILQRARLTAAKRRPRAKIYFEHDRTWREVAKK